MECLRETYVKDLFEKKKQISSDNGLKYSLSLRLKIRHISMFFMLVIKAILRWSCSYIATKIWSLNESDGVFARNLREGLFLKKESNFTRQWSWIQLLFEIQNETHFQVLHACHLGRLAMIMQLYRYKKLELKWIRWSVCEKLTWRTCLKKRNKFQATMVLNTAWV